MAIPVSGKGFALPTGAGPGISSDETGWGNWPSGPAQTCKRSLLRENPGTRGTGFTRFADGVGWNGHAAGRGGLVVDLVGLYVARNEALPWLCRGVR